MSRNFETLCKLLAEDIDFSKVINPKLKGLLKRITCKTSTGYIFFGKGKHHKDTSSHTDGGGRDYTDSDSYFYHDGYSETSHTDHADHTDINKDVHEDHKYGESYGHTESNNGHSDHTRNDHTDH